MKKNLLSVLILALLIVDIALTAVMLVSVTNTNTKTAKLVDNIATAMNLELTVPGQTSSSGVTLADTDVYNITDSMTIPLKVGEDGKQHYVLLAVSLSINKTAEDYESFSSEAISTYEPLITSAITTVASSYTYEDWQEDRESIREEVLTAIQNTLQTSSVYDVVFSSVQYG